MTLAWRHVKGNNGRYDWKAGEALNRRLKKLYFIHIGWGKTEGVSKALACSNLCNRKINPEECRKIIYETTVINNNSGMG